MSVPLELAMTAAFVGAVLMILYVFVGYPILLLASPRRAKIAPAAGRLPKITVLVSVHNGERVIGQKLENALQSRYPEDLLEVLVASDGSVDGTDGIVNSVPDRRVCLVSFRVRRGKSACLNDAVPLARGEIVLFTDANALLEPDAVERAACWFADERIGFVSGRTIYTDATGGGVLDLYSRLEGWIKERQSRTGNCVGADGAVFAIRRRLFPILEDDDINDLAIPLAVIAKGFQGVSDGSIVCREDSPPGGRRGFLRQIRITSRSLRAILRAFHLANPLTGGWFSLHFVSHKVLRYLVPPAMMVALLANAVLAVWSPYFRWLLALHLAGYALAGAGLMTEPRVAIFRPARLLGGFLVVQVAILLAWIRLFAGARDVIWEPSHHQTLKTRDPKP